MPSDDRLSRAERELFMRSFARGASVQSPAVLRALTEAMSDAHYPAGSMLYQKGALPRYIYYVVTGRVQLSAEGLAPLYYDKLSAIGGLDMLQEIPYSRTAVAVQDTRVLMLGGSKYLQVIEENYEFARQMVTFMVGNIDPLGSQIALSELYHHAHAEVPEPPASERRLGLLERMMAARQAPLFGGLRSQVLVAIAEKLEERTVAPGERVDRADTFWIVASGEVRAARRTAGVAPGAEAAFDVHTFRAGDVVLSFAVFADAESKYETSATRPSRLLGLRKDDFFDLLEDHGDVARVALAYGARERSRVQARLAELDLVPPPMGSITSPR